jgi:predicted RNase H-like HicB family nuclease
MRLDEETSGPIFRVALSPGEDGYIVAECLNLPGCMSQGKTEAEALENITDAIKACLSVIMEDAMGQVESLPQEMKDGLERRDYKSFKPRIDLIGLTA